MKTLIAKPVTLEDYIKKLQALRRTAIRTHGTEPLVAVPQYSEYSSDAADPKLVEFWDGGQPGALNTFDTRRPKRWYVLIGEVR